MPLCMTVSWIYTVALAVQAIVYEKEQRLKEVMKMMGLSNAVHWVAWFITSVCVMSITVSLLVGILKVNVVTCFPVGVTGITVRANKNVPNCKQTQSARNKK